MKTYSEKWSLIWLDVRSWLITSFLTLAPVSVGFLITYLQGKDLGVFSGAVLIVLGSFLKLLQKAKQINDYEPE